jgi:DMSO/TMAO reductase YedYZ molybdopterin-dependent catalytic subunit
MVTRRHVIVGAAGSLAAGLVPQSVLASAPVTPGVPAGVEANAVLDALPGKRKLIKLSYRPPNYETPLPVFNEAITPNDAFFVRYHLSNIPEVEEASWRLKVGGDGAANAQEYSLADLRGGFEPVEVVAVCQCSGNRRGLSKPHVQGVQWGYGAMGNARWKGIRLKDVLAKAGLSKETIEIAFDGADGPVAEKTPDFVKSIPTWRALDESTLIAFEMNGRKLPHWNGAPARIVVPGWTGTYWMKHVISIEARTKPLQTFWMNPAYRIPLGKFPVVDRFTSQETAANTPITEMVVNSLITNLAPGQKVKAGAAVEIRGIAWDGGQGIPLVEVSTDGGGSWKAASLGKDLGRYSFRPWRLAFTPEAGRHALMVRATNRLGASQPMEAVFNPAGYHHNAVQRVEVTAA